MQFEYNSTQSNSKRKLPDNIVQELRQVMIDKAVGPSWHLDELQDLLLNFEAKDGSHLLIHQAEPIFVYLARAGHVWDEP